MLTSEIPLAGALPPGNTARGCEQPHARGDDRDATNHLHDTPDLCVRPLGRVIN